MVPGSLTAIWATSTCTVIGKGIGTGNVAVKWSRSVTGTWKDNNVGKVTVTGTTDK